MYKSVREERERVGITIRKSEEMAREKEKGKDYVQIKQKMTGVKKIQRERATRLPEHTGEKERKSERVIILQLYKRKGA